MKCSLKHMKCYAHSIVISYYQLSDLSFDNISFQPSPWNPVGPMRGPVDQAWRAVQRKNLQGNLRQNLKIAECSRMWICYFLCQIFIWSFLFSVILVARWGGIIIVCFVPLFHASILGTQYSTNDFASLLLAVFKTQGVAQDMDWEYTQ